MAVSDDMVRLARNLELGSTAPYSLSDGHSLHVLAMDCRELFQGQLIIDRQSLGSCR